MSNLHVDLDELNKHDPKGFIPAVNNTFPVKDELGNSFYEERMSLPKAINFVDGTVAAPTTVDGDIYVLTGSGVVDSSWGGATFGDWVRFLNTFATPITPLDGYLCFDVTAATWMQYDGSVWAVFGGGGGGGDTIFTGGTMAAPSTVAMAGFGLNFEDGKFTHIGDQITTGVNFLLKDGNNADVLQVDGYGTISHRGAPFNFLLEDVTTFRSRNSTALRGAFAFLKRNDDPLLTISMTGVGINKAGSTVAALDILSISTVPIRITGIDAVSAFDQFTDVGKGGTITTIGYTQVTGERPSSGWFGLKASTVNGAALEIKNGVDPTGVALKNGTIWYNSAFNLKGGAKIIGTGITSGTTALLVQNSVGTDLLEVKDDGTSLFSGNVGFGHTAPTFNVHIEDAISSNNGLKVGTSTNSRSLIINTGGDVYQYDSSGVNTYKLEGGLAYFKGNVGFGKSAPTWNVQIEDVISSTKGLKVGNSTNNSAFVVNTNGEPAMLNSGGSQIFRIWQLSDSFIHHGGKFGVGLSTGITSQLTVKGGDIEVVDIGDGIILTSPDSTRYRVTVANGGTLSVAAV